MAGKLIQVDKEIITSSTASVTLTGIDSDDIYMVAVSGVYPVTADQALRMKFTVSGTPDSTSNYQNAYVRLKTGGAGLVESANSGSDYHQTTYNNADNAGDETQNFIMHLYNFANSSGHSIFTINSVGWYAQTTESLTGAQGSGSQTVNQACDGVHFYMASGNIAAGKFAMYKVVT